MSARDLFVCAKISTLKLYHVVSLRFLSVAIPYTANTAGIAGYPTTLSGLAPG